MRYLLLISAVLLGTVMISGCAITTTHPSLDNGALPTLIPVRKFVANVDYNEGYRISPDGKKIAWNGVSRLKDAILWRELSSTTTKALRFRKSSPGLSWAADSRHILYHHDPSGRENHHVFAVDTADPKLIKRDLTPYPGVKAFIARVPVKQSNFVYIFHNRRDKEVFDLYSVNIVSGEEKLRYKNNENTICTLVNDDGQVRARVRQTEQSRLLEVPVNQTNQWKTLIDADRFDAINPIDLSADGSGLYLLSNVARDKSSLVHLNLDTGEEKTIVEHSEVDINHVFMSQRDRRPLLAYALPGYPELIFLDDQLRQRLMPFLRSDRPGGLNVISIDRNEQHATIAS